MSSSGSGKVQTRLGWQQEIKLLDSKTCAVKGVNEVPVQQTECVGVKRLVGSDFQGPEWLGREVVRRSGRF